MSKEYDDHHRLPKSLGGKRNSENISRVKRKQHEAWHILFGNMTAFQIAEVINGVWLDPNFKFHLIQRSNPKRRVK